MVERQLNLQGMTAQQKRTFLSNPDNLPDLDSYEEEVVSAEIGRLSIYYNIEKLDKPDEFIDDFEDKFNKTDRGRNFLDKVADGLSVYTYLVRHDAKSISMIERFKVRFRTRESRVSKRKVAQRILYEWRPTKESRAKVRINQTDYEGIAQGTIRQVRYKDQHGNQQIRYFNGRQFMRTDLGKTVLKEVGLRKNIQRKVIGEEI